MSCRARRCLLGVLALVAGLAPAAGAAQASDGRPGWAGLETLAGLHGEGLQRGAIADLRAFVTGHADEGAVYGTTAAPVKPAHGNAHTLLTEDVDGDGDAELIQARGTAAKPKLGVVDGATGALLWEQQQQTYAFGVAAVPDADGADVLRFANGTAARIDGRTGTTHWTRSLPVGNQGAGSWGVVESGDGWELVVGAWDIPVFQLVDLHVEFWSLDTGAVTGTAVVTGEGTFPTIAPAGDLDGDGVGDLLGFEPLYTFAVAGAGTLSALTARGASRAWSAPVAQELYDNTYVIAAPDVTGDGTSDAVLLSEFLGADGQTPTDQAIVVVDGEGGAAAGLRPVVSVDLQHVAHTVVSPGDLNGDGGADLIFSGWGVNVAEGVGVVVLEAVGKGGRLWSSTPSYPATSDFVTGWWPQAGDLDGDGAQDALVLLGSDAQGIDRAVAVSQRGGATIWTHDGLAGRFVIPALADGDGDGADDVLDDVAVVYEGFTKTVISMRMAAGRDRAVLWEAGVTLDIGKTPALIEAHGGRLRPGGQADVVFSFNTQGGRRYVAAHDGASGEIRWRDPAA